MHLPPTTTLKKWSAWASGIAGILGLLFAIWKVDDRYVKASQFKEISDANKIAIITETRYEIVKNRTAMIYAMERDVDDLEYEISILRESSEDIPRYLFEKKNQLRRDIDNLKRQ